MDRFELQIPDSQAPAFASLLSLSDQALEALLAGLRDLEPSVFLGSSSQELAERTGIDVNRLAPILVMISSLFGLREQSELSPDELTDEILEATESHPELATDEGARARLHRFLQAVLGLDDTLGVTSKAWSVARDFQRTYCHSRVLTDLRPVFRPSSTSPAALVVVHNLKIAYHEGESLEEVFVGLTGKDLVKLKKTVDRAIDKEQQLVDALSGGDIPLLEVE